MIGMTLLAVGLAVFFFFVYGRHKMAKQVRVEMASVATGDAPSRRAKPAVE